MNKNGDCFVATAAYGTPLAEEIKYLREVRDNFLLNYALGRCFIFLYNVIGPHFARLICKHHMLRKMARSALWPFVQIARYYASRF